jgi:plastocyanin
MTTTLGALAVGLATSVHCAGMCGPIACGVGTLARSEGERLTAASLYHASRLAAYTVLGAIFGAIGSAPLKWFFDSPAVLLPWALVAALLLLATGLDKKIPRPKILNRLTARARIRSGGLSVYGGSTAMGLLTPFLPCGPLYAVFLALMASGSAARGAIGLIVVDSEAELEPHRHIDAQGPSYTDEEKAEFVEGATRVIAPFGIGTHPVDRPVVFGPHIEHVDVSIIGNSFHPKVIEVYPGTEVTWTNEDVFAYMGGEFAGIHNAVAISMPEGADAFATPLLAHAESSSIVVETPGEYEYICAPHPYMKAKVIVRDPKDD